MGHTSIVVTRAMTGCGEVGMAQGACLVRVCGLSDCLFLPALLPA